MRDNFQMFLECAALFLCWDLLTNISMSVVVVHLPFRPFSIVKLHIIAINRSSSGLTGCPSIIIPGRAISPCPFSIDIQPSNVNPICWTSKGQQIIVGDCIMDGCKMSPFINTSCLCNIWCRLSCCEVPLSSQKWTMSLCCGLFHHFLSKDVNDGKIWKLSYFWAKRFASLKFVLRGRGRYCQALCPFCVH